MKLTLLWTTLVAILMTSCKKDEVVSKPVDFTGTSYQNLGTFNENGKPDYLLPKDVISSEFLAFINNTLPENKDLRKSNPELLTTKAIADIAITKPSDVFISFVSHGALYKNTFAFYTYPTNNPPASSKEIRTITYIFPSAGFGTPLQAGDKVKLGRFEVGTSIGFVILPQAWDPANKKIDNGAVHFCSNDVLNPEIDVNLKKHAVLVNYPSENKVLIGFEDVNRTLPNCDHDFNDVVFYATVLP